MRTIVRGSREHRAWTAAGRAAAAAVVLALPFVVSEFRTFQFTVAIVYAIAVLGLNLLTGYSGQITLGHSAFFGLGAYAAAILIADHDWHYLAVIPVAAAVTFVAGFLVGVPALRLKGLYLALLTLGLAVAWPPLLRRYADLTGGSQGITVSSRQVAAPGWTGLDDDTYRYFLILAIAVVLFVLARNLVRSRVGRALTSIRDNETPAVTLGIHLARYKTFVFAVSAMYAGIAGVGYVYLIRYVAPGSFLVLLSISFLAGMVVGGLATIGGAVVGGLFIQFMPVYSQEINQSLSGLVYGVVLIVVMILMPGGFVGLLRRAASRVVTIAEPPLSAPR